MPNSVAVQPVSVCTIKDITETLLELALSKGRIVRDSRWANAYNALMREPSSGRMLKVVYRRTGTQL